MRADQFKDHIQGKIPAKYIYISRNIYTVKGIPIYLLYYNSRIPNSKISRDVVKRQHVLKVRALFGETIRPIQFESPLLLDEYTKEIRPNSITIFVDLAGSYMSKDNNL